MLLNYHIVKYNIYNSGCAIFQNWIESNHFCNDLRLVSPGALPSLKGSGEQGANTAALLPHPFHHAGSCPEHPYQSGLVCAIRDKRLSAFPLETSIFQTSILIYKFSFILGNSF